MESRIARIESDVANLKETVTGMQGDMREMRRDLNATRESVADLKVGLATLDGKRWGCWRRLDAEINAVETRLIKWMIGTTLATSSAAFSFAKFLS